MRKQIPMAPPRTPHFSQTELVMHEEWGRLIRRSPLAGQIMHFLAARVGEHNAVIISQDALASLVGATRRGVQKALALLEAENWLETWQVGATSTALAYVLNDRVIWTKPRDGLRYSLFSSAVIISSAEQPNKDLIEQRKPLKRLPALFPGERQLPTGDGLPPPSEPSLPGMEPDLPARRAEPQQLDLEDAITFKEPRT